MCPVAGFVAAAAGAGALVIDLIKCYDGDGDPIDAMADAGAVVIGAAGRLGKAIARPATKVAKAAWDTVVYGANAYVDALGALARELGKTFDRTGGNHV